MMQRKGLPLFLGQFVETRLNQGATSRWSARSSGPVSSPGDAIENVVFFISRALHSPDEASLVLRRMSSINMLRAIRNSQPRNFRPQVIPRLLVELDQRVLGQVFGELNIAGVADEESDQRRLISIHEFIEGGVIALLKSDHQLVIVSHRTQW